MPYFPTRKTTIIAQDPSVRLNRKILRAQVEIPNEELQPGPRGYRVQVVDYDSSTHTLYKTLPHGNAPRPEHALEDRTDVDGLAGNDVFAHGRVTGRVAPVDEALFSGGMAGSRASQT